MKIYLRDSDTLHEVLLADAHEVTLQNEDGDVIRIGETTYSQHKRRGFDVRADDVLHISPVAANAVVLLPETPGRLHLRP